MIITALILGWLGLCFGSFVGALVWRIHEKKDWVKARSQCERCGHRRDPRARNRLLHNSVLLFMHSAAVKRQNKRVDTRAKTRRRWKEN